MRVALVQLNPTVGDLEGNAFKILMFARRAVEEGASLVVFPELALPGYPPLDLLEREPFLRACASWERRLVEDLPRDLAAIFGNIADKASSGDPGPPIINAAIVAQHGKVTHRFAKSLLPTYDVFDEARYFCANPRPGETWLDLGGHRIGVTICEDIWNDPDFWPKESAGRDKMGGSPQLYATNPVGELAQAGVETIVNLSASPFALGKQATRHAMLRHTAQKHGVVVAYANLVGANDGLIFDGGAIAFDAAGALLAQGPFWEEGLVLFETASPDVHRAQLAGEPAVDAAIAVGAAWSVGARGAAAGDRPAAAAETAAAAAETAAAAAADGATAGDRATATAAEAGGGIRAPIGCTDGVRPALGEALRLSSADESLRLSSRDPLKPSTSVLAREASGRVPHVLEPTEAIHHALVTGIRDYFAKSRLSLAVIGLSGGIDSAVTAYLAAHALGSRSVLGVAMPSAYSSQGSLDDAEELARNLSIPFLVIPIQPVFERHLEGLAPAFEGRARDITEENLQSRIRGMTLMALANKRGGVVLSTGNKSESAMGYCTLYGDTVGALAVLGDLYKHQVYAIAGFANRERAMIPESSISKPPSAELAPGQRDDDTLPPYPVLDRVLELFIEERLDIEGIARKIEVSEDLVRWILRQVYANEFKRRQLPPTLRVTRRSWTGRRYPVVQRFIE